MKFYLLNLFVLNTLHVCLCSNGPFYLTFNNNRSEFVVAESGSPINTVDIEWKVHAFYKDSVKSTGWDILEIRTNPKLKDDDQAYHAGWIEGYLTQQKIYYHYYNTQKFFCDKISATCNNIRQYIKKNFVWLYEKFENPPEHQDFYWHQVSLYYKQLEGLYDGYKEALKDDTQKISPEDLLWINYVTDIMTLQESLAAKEEAEHIEKHGHCSVLIKLLPGFTDVLFAHNSWITYNFMNRVIKRYNFGYHWSNDSLKLIPGQSMAFSSYAGVITSIDDFYIINSGLFVTETTNNVYNMDIYKHNKPNGQILESVRSAVANRLATDTESWSYYYSMYNSGTYNNQWMILDLKKFRPGFKPEQGFLRVIEQMPGKIESQDQTDHIVANSYWASYNIPFYKNIYQYAGYDKKVQENGTYYSYSECARAKIFQREQEKVYDIDSMIKTIRYNHYKTDPYSVCQNCTPDHNACLAVASRCDLNPKNGNYTLRGLKYETFGAIDAKIASYSMFKRGEMVSISGPITSDGLPPFQWSKAQTNDMKHLGQPDLWNFPPLLTSWLHFINMADESEAIKIIYKKATYS